MTLLALPSTILIKALVFPQMTLDNTLNPSSSAALLEFNEQIFA